MLQIESPASAGLSNLYLAEAKHADAVLPNAALLFCMHPPALERADLLQYTFGRVRMQFWPGGAPAIFRFTDRTEYKQENFWENVRKRLHYSIGPQFSGESL